MLDRDWLPHWLGGLVLGVIALMGAAVVWPEHADHRTDGALRAALRAGTTVFAAMELPPAQPGPRSASEPVLLRWSEDDVVVLQTSDRRIRYDGEVVTEDSVQGTQTRSAEWAERLAGLARVVRNGLPRPRLRPVRPGELPAFAWSPGQDLYRLRLPKGWPDGWLLLVGIDVTDGSLAELALTDAEGAVQAYRGLALRAQVRRVEFGVPLGPDMGDAVGVPLVQLGGHTVFGDRPPQVLRDLPWHERVQHVALVPSPDRSTGVRGAHGADVLDVMMQTVWCNTADATGREEARLIFGMPPAGDDRDRLVQALERGCSLELRTAPKTAHVLDDQVRGVVGVTGQLAVGDRVVWAHDARVEHVGPAVRYGQPVLRGEVASVGPAEVDSLELRLDVSLEVSCSIAKGKGRLRGYLAEVAQPRLHWSCPR